MTFLPDSTLRHLQQVANWPDLSGTRYRVTALIARGGMGTVYLAADEELRREVAIKVSNAQVGDSELDARMRIEAGILARLEHPGIVPIHDAGRLPDGRAYYVMKRVEGRTLLEYLHEHGELSDRLGVFERICQPVAFAHACGYVHRDLKPENIMVGSYGEVLVMDWGVAKVLGEPESIGPGGGPATGFGRTDPGTVMGTRGYMPPEQALGLVDEIDQRADVFALGAILFTMLTGSAPTRVATEDVETALQRARGLPKRLRAICAKAMAGDREARYPGAGQLAEDVARFRAGQPVDAYPETLLDRLDRLVSIYRTAILLIVAYLIMRVVVALVS